MLDSRPERSEALIGATRAWALAGEAEEAVARGEKARDLKLVHAEPALVRGLLDLGRGPEALALIRASDGVDPLLPRALLLSEALLSTGEAAGAFAALQDAGDGPEVQVLRAWSAWRAQGAPACPAATDQALAATRVAIEDPWIQARAAAVLRLCGDQAGTRTAAAAARTWLLEGSGPFLQAAARRDQGGDREGPAWILAQARAMYPDDGMVAYQLGRYLLLAGAPALAVPELKAALALEPFQIDPQKHEIVVGGFGYEPDARRILVQDLWQALYRAHAGAGQEVDAIAALERSVLLEPQQRAQDWAQVARGWMAARIWRRAEAAARTALALDGNDPSSWLLLSDVAWASGDAAGSAGFAERAWEIRRGDPDIAVRLARGRLAVGEAEEARRVCETSLQLLRGGAHAQAAELQRLLAEAQRRSGG